MNKCSVCPHHCQLKEGQIGRCRVRIMEGGDTLPLYYGQISAIQLDPMEKKPLYHFLPGSKVLSVGQYGCSMDCGFCQNAHLLDPPSLSRPPLMPRDILEMCIEQGAPAIAFTYNEPLIHPEMVVDTFILARQAGIKTVLVTNGFASEETLDKVLPFVDGMNIDLKAFTDPFYQKHGGRLTPVKKTIERAYQRGVHLELTTLLIPGENDELTNLKDMVQWIHSIDWEIPLHISRYYPAREYRKAATSHEKMMAVEQMAKESLRYVYLGNLPFINRNTSCTCGNDLIERFDDWSVQVHLRDERCPRCNRKHKVVL